MRSPKNVTEAAAQANELQAKRIRLEARQGKIRLALQTARLEAELADTAAESFELAVEFALASAEWERLVLLERAAMMPPSARSASHKCECANCTRDRMAVN